MESALEGAVQVARLVSGFQSLPEALYVASEDGRLLGANPALLALLGVGSLEEANLRGGLAAALSPAEWSREVTLVSLQGSIRGAELGLTPASGERRTVLHTASWMSSEEPGVAGAVQGILVDISARKRFEERLLEQSQRDPLTGCYNRRYLEAFGARVHAAGERWGCILVDVDRFKDYNDSCGHEAGDRVLVKLSRFLMRRTRADEGVVRLGGDEFLLLLNRVDEMVTQHVADRLRLAASHEDVPPFSLGWAARRDGERLDQTIDRADRHLLAVKSTDRVPKRRRADSGAFAAVRSGDAGEAGGTLRPGGPGDGAAGAAVMVRPGGPGDGAAGAVAVSLPAPSFRVER